VSLAEFEKLASWFVANLERLTNEKALRLFG
jgi:hypothetical protein